MSRRWTAETLTAQAQTRAIEKPRSHWSEVLPAAVVVLGIFSIAVSPAFNRKETLARIAEITGSAETPAAPDPAINNSGTRHATFMVPAALRPKPFPFVDAVGDAARDLGQAGEDPYADYVPDRSGKHRKHTR